MTKGRVEAFTDGVLAIVITIMVLELKVPHTASGDELVKLWPTLLSYVLSFIFVGIYWNNHHHFFQAARHVNGAVLWANLTVLFWLSLIPFATNWMGETRFANIPVATYGGLMVMCAISFNFMVASLVRANGKDSEFAKRLGTDWKSKISLVLYVVGVGLAWFSTVASCICYAAVSAMWFIPDRRFEHRPGDPVPAEAD